MPSSLDSISGWPGWSALDRQLANLLLREVGSQSVPLWLSVALLTWVSRQGDVCVDLEHCADRPLADVLTKTSYDTEAAIPEALRLPKTSDWQKLLLESGLVGDDGARYPLVLKGHRLYLQRYRQHETVLAARLVERLIPVQRAADTEALRPLLDYWFQDSGVEAKQAAVIAATRRLCLITGGPGTGKTSTVVRLLGLLSELLPRADGRALRVLLLAPTGKAAARLSESIVQAKQHLGGLATRIQELPTQASTVHAAVAGCRWLPDGTQIPLSADIVILDEASMVDLALMRRLLDSARHVERLVVLGDPYQLASVEAGAVLGELCRGLPSGDGSAGVRTLAAHRVELTQSHRFRMDGGIGLLARSIKTGDVTGALDILGGGDAEVRFLDSSEWSPAQLEQQFIVGNEQLLGASNPVEALNSLERFRVLCAHRRGRFGVETWNERLRRRLAQLQERHRHWVQVEPILITENATNIGLYNGDLGIVWREPKRERAWFAKAAKSAAEFGMSRLPKHEPAYVMSVHKSQGSEVDEVVILLPEAGSALLTRELLYTAVTRARKRCTLVGTRAALEQAIRHQVERHSGLGDAIADLLAHDEGPEA